MKKVLLPLLFSVCTFLVKGQPSIVPEPVSVEWTASVFTITPSTYILANDFDAFMDAVAFRDLCLKFKDFPLKTTTKKMGNGPVITVQYDSSSTLPPGGYTLIIQAESVLLTGSSDGGVFNGLMTLLQLIVADHTKGIQVPCGTITDYPRFSWRGMHLDVSRHFFDIISIKEYIDFMALYKFNTFHWHLTDDQGWRMEIQQYPKLVEVGSVRNGSMVGHYSDQTYDTIRYSGHYSQAEIKEIVKYAEKRHITIIPEIEMPGHAMAALAAYPEFSCTGGPFEVGKAWGVYEDVFCPTEETFAFLENILDEVMELFPSQIIHIGGDEVPKERWMSCPHCQNLMKAEGLKNEEELQSYFVHRIEQYLNSKGRRIIGWDEILEGGLAPNALVMSWRGTEGGMAAAKAGHPVVMSPNNDCYFDHYQGDPSFEPLAIGGMTTLQDVYQFEPVPEGLTKEEAAFIMGAQANVWTEYIPNFEHVEYMIFPRMMALSEVLWSSSETMDFDAFKQKLSQQMLLLDAEHVNYSRTWMKQ